MYITSAQREKYITLIRITHFWSINEIQGGLDQVVKGRDGRFLV